MGRWMESINNKQEVILEMAPNFLIHCSKHLPKKLRSKFPMLSGLAIDSDQWTDESQTFKSSKITALKNEIERVQKLLNKEEFTSVIKNEKIFKFWITSKNELIDINNEIDMLKSFFAKSLTKDLKVKIYL